MQPFATRIYEPAYPREKDRLLARKSSQSLSGHLTTLSAARLRVIEKGETVGNVLLPNAALKLLADLLAEMARGNAVTLVSVHAELTTQQAADLLRISRPVMLRLLEQRKIPFRKVGTHRRVLFKDLMDYKQAVDGTLPDTLDDLAKETQELDINHRAGGQKRHRP